MVQFGVYFDVLDWLEKQEKLDPSTFLQRLQAAYGTGPVTYLDGAISNGRLRTYNLHHSQRRETPQIARALHRRPGVEQIARAFSALEPVQLDSWAKSGVEGNAPVILAYPLPGLPGRHSCILVQTTLTGRQLAAWRRANDRDLVSLGGRLHARIGSTTTIDLASPSAAHSPLTRRERETLAWIAAGKSYWEAAVILGISERTIRYFMANARQKLDVVNNAQAVAEAVWRGLIPRLAEPRTP
ncbi:LuxR family quorum-sensing system transcriptional regulator SinR [Peteryoungia aggregata LMG 23059]|uniref:LuxR family quorum-sensing system transcriptional regulator SinR n=1 Tax=Peteryoungia aggregata LMG 23059 TaxID=1368425 RepID=A0ABU0G7W9_9HYPH|nr:helix-turn-helix domain-containing protein [Peteryoungia aggregata]MDQ0421443.1 LuxR family quorum-sensing system transcriptional regulator SinR [Peteryoungia aggregata LMG 23059]